MCGIAGFFRTCAPYADDSVLKRMGEVIRHRGPDAGGEYLDEQVGLAHRRLSIIDLSPQGNQPMISADGRLVIVFNGEIYNFLELRAELEKAGVSFRSRTDTEVLLALYQRQGNACLKLLNGMFAFAIWDKVDKTLFMARDRIGKKPLYYYHGGGDRLAFASEIKSLLQLPGLSPKVEPTALTDFLKYLYIPAPKTIYRNIYKLLPGHSMVLRPGGQPVIEQYWDVDFSAMTPCSQDEAQEELVELLLQSTACRMIADVPLGAFLSGGVDSSAVVALMAKVSAEPVRTCSIGFDDKRHDETPYAREVASLFATDHHEYCVQSRLEDTVALLPKYFDEPFADSSAVPTFHVSRLARQAVTVALAGDGGDESFAGYEKYAVELKENLARRYIPKSLLAALHAGVGGFSHPAARKARSLTGSALLDPGRAFYVTNSHVDDATLERLLADGVRRACSGYDPAESTMRYYDRMSGADHVTRMLYTDLKHYLPDDILVKVDRMSMAHSLEVRAPFLDYRVIEFAASLPSDWKIKGSSKKIILRKAFGRLLPERILNRPKQGFSVPLDAWFRHELKPFAESCLLGGAALAEYIDTTSVRELWHQHQEQNQDHSSVLWSLLMFALWRMEYQVS
ncbi:MAG: asparagine synthase (glutamine-hydrolyzing) [Desulfuromonadales bacterium]